MFKKGLKIPHRQRGISRPMRSPQIMRRRFHWPWGFWLSRTGYFSENNTTTNIPGNGGHRFDCWEKNMKMRPEYKYSLKYFTIVKWP